MNEYARCAKHNLMRCGICNRPPKVTAPAPATSVPAVGFDPSDLLDKPAEVLDGPSAPAPVIDAQAQEAIERNRAIYALPADLAKDILADPNIAKGLFEIDPPFALDPRRSASPNPIVTAAQEYAQAQVVAQMATRKVETLRLELQQAENAAADAIADRDVKKTVIAKLVAS